MVNNLKFMTLLEFFNCYFCFKDECSSLAIESYKGDKYYNSSNFMLKCLSCNLSPHTIYLRANEDETHWRFYALLISETIGTLFKSWIDVCI